MTTTEILRIKNSRDIIRAKLVALGLAESTARIDVLATVIDEVPDNGALDISIDGFATMSYTIPRGYSSGGTVSLTDDIENALSEI